MSRKSSYRFHNIYNEPIKETKEENPIEKAFDTVDLDDKNEVTADKETELRKAPVAKVNVPESTEKIVKKMDDLLGRPGKVNVLCNMRKEPNMGSDILHVLAAGTSIKIYSNPGDFYKVKFDGQTGYIKKELCS